MSNKSKEKYLFQCTHTCLRGLVYTKGCLLAWQTEHVGEASQAGVTTQQLTAARHCNSVLTAAQKVIISHTSAMLMLLAILLYPICCELLYTYPARILDTRAVGQPLPQQVSKHCSCYHPGLVLFSHQFSSACLTDGRRLPDWQADRDMFRDVWAREIMCFVVCTFSSMPQVTLQVCHQTARQLWGVLNKQQRCSNRS